MSSPGPLPAKHAAAGPSTHAAAGAVSPASRPARSLAALSQAAPVAVGLAVQAVTTYLTLIVAGRLLGAAGFGGLGALYVVISSIATGLFLPLEQEIARRRGQERETRAVDHSLVPRALVVAAAACLLVVGLVVVARDQATTLLGEEPALVVAFCVALPGYALCFVSRGTFSGAGRLRRYGVQLGTEGAFRLLGLAVLTVGGVEGAAALGWLFAFAPWVALAVSLVGLRRDRATTQKPEPRARPPALLPALALLGVSCLSAQLLIGAGPVLAQLFAESDGSARVGAFLAALVVVRLPVFLFTAVQPSMLPAMAAHSSGDRKAAFLGHLRRVLVALSMVAVLTTIVTTVLGPLGLRVLFGPDYELTWGVFLLMGVSVGAYMVASVLAQAILALGSHVSVMLGWLAGLVGLALGTALAEGVVGKATWGLLVGAVLAAVTFLVLLVRAASRWRPATLDLEPLPPSPGTAQP